MSTSFIRRSISGVIHTDTQSLVDICEKSRINEGNSYFKYLYGMPGPSYNIFFDGGSQTETDRHVVANSDTQGLACSEKTKITPTPKKF
jgi:hypothetical protein